VDSCFTGKEEDVEVGLQYFGKRFYAPLLGRWVSADPLTTHGLGGDLNLYAYVSGQALKATDPLGLDPWWKDPQFNAAAERAQATPPAPATSSSDAKPTSATPKATAEPTIGSPQQPCPTCEFVKEGAAAAYMTLQGAAAWVAGYVVGRASGDSHEQSVQTGLETAGKASPTIQGNIQKSAAITAFRSAEPAIVGRSGAPYASRGVAGETPRFDPIKLDKIRGNLRGQLEIKYDAEWLSRYGDEAQFYPGGAGRPSTIVLKPNPSRAAVVEELTHFGQWRRAQQQGASAAEFRANLVATEIQAHEKLIPLRMWTETERQGFIDNLKYWIQRQ
jgi:RHS repeat-associated protein